MNSYEYSGIKTLKEIRVARNANRSELIRVEKILNTNLMSMRKSLRMGSIFVNLLGNSFSVVSHLCFYRRGYLWVRSLLMKKKMNKTAPDKKE